MSWEHKCYDSKNFVVNTSQFPYTFYEDFLQLLMYFQFLRESIWPHWAKWYPLIWGIFNVHQLLLRGLNHYTKAFSTCFVDARESKVPYESVDKCIGIFFAYSLNNKVSSCLTAKTPSSANLLWLKVSASLKELHTLSFGLLF